MADDQLNKTKTNNSLINYIVENSETYDIYREQKTSKPNTKKENFNYILKYTIIFLALFTIFYFVIPPIISSIQQYIKN
jgi:predicted secreted protein